MRNFFWLLSTFGFAFMVVLSIIQLALAEQGTMAQLSAKVSMFGWLILMYVNHPPEEKKS